MARNRAKRRLREAFRLCRHQLSGPYDVILLARAGIAQGSASEICNELLTLARQAGIFTRLTTSTAQNSSREITP